MTSKECEKFLFCSEIRREERNEESKTSVTASVTLGDILCVVLMEGKIAFPEVPYEGFHKQILLQHRTRERGKACDVVVKEH